MVLDVDGETFLRRVVGGSLGYGPGAEHPFHFEPQIEMQPPGSVLVNDKESARRSLLRS
jgi:hypothetical protein